MMKNKIISVFLAVIIVLGMFPIASATTTTSTSLPQPQINRVFQSNVFIMSETGYTVLDRNIGLSSTEANDLRRQFDRFFLNELVGLYIPTYTSQIAIKPIDGIEPVAMIYNPKTNSYRTLKFIKTDGNGFWVFDVPEKISTPLNVIISNNKLESGAKPNLSTTNITYDNSSNDDEDDDNNSSVPNNPNTPATPPAGDDVSLFSVTDISPDGENSVQIEATASDTAILNVKILTDVTGISTDWDSGAQIASGQTDIEEAIEKEFVSVEVSPKLPDYFVVVATIFDDSGRQLCEPYVFIENTKAYEEYENKTTGDFAAERIINLDDDETNNFLVVAEDVPHIHAGENGANYLDASRVEEGIYSFTDANNIVTELRTGNRIIAIGEDNMIYLIDISRIQINGGTVTINGALNPAIGEFTEFIKVDSEDLEFGKPEIDMSSADDGVVLLDDNDSSYDIVIDHSDDAPSLDYILATPTNDIEPLSSENTRLYSFAALSPNTRASGSTSDSIKYGIKYKNDRLTINGNVTAKGTVSVKMVYDSELFGPKYFECKLSVKVDTEAQAQVALVRESEDSSSIELKLGTAHFPSPIWGLSVKVEVFAPLQWELSTSVIATATAKVEAGVRFGSVSFEPFLTKSMSADLKSEGEASFTLGSKLAFGVSFIGFLEAKLTTQAGLDVKATAVENYPNLAITTEDSVHACTLCVDGTADVFVKAGVAYKASVADIDELTWENEYTFREWRIRSAEFFVSLHNEADSIYGGQVKFGWGECINNAYRTIINPQNEGITIDSAEVSVRKVGGGVVATSTGKFIKMLYPGQYVASATARGITFANKRFTVSNAGQTIIISESGGSLITGQGILNGDVVDAETNQPISGASIKAYSSLMLVESETSTSFGNYAMRLTAGPHRIDFSAPGYLPFSNYITVEEDRSHYLEASLMVEDSEGEGTTTGIIRNAIDGQALPGVNLALSAGWGNIGGEVIKTANTGENGQYNITLPFGHYTVTMLLDGYVTDSFNIVVKRSSTVKYATLSPIQEYGEYRVVLTWGSEPRDLDSHLTASGVHISYIDMTSNYAWLDVDDTSSYGPETTTITNLSLLGGFHFSIHDYTNRRDGTTQLSSSGATVRVYNGSELMRTYNVPSGRSGTVWKVFSISTDGRITDINTFEFQSEPSLIGSGNLTRSLKEVESAPLKDYELDSKTAANGETTALPQNSVNDETIDDNNNTSSDETSINDTTDNEASSDGVISVDDAEASDSADKSISRESDEKTASAGIAIVDISEDTGDLIVA